MASHVDLAASYTAQQSFATAGKRDGAGAVSAIADVQAGEKSDRISDALKTDDRSSGLTRESRFGPSVVVSLSEEARPKLQDNTARTPERPDGSKKEGSRVGAPENAANDRPEVQPAVHQSIAAANRNERSNAANAYNRSSDLAREGGPSAKLSLVEVERPDVLGGTPERPKGAKASSAEIAGPASTCGEDYAVSCVDPETGSKRSITVAASNEAEAQQKAQLKLTGSEKAGRAVNAQ